MRARLALLLLLLPAPALANNRTWISASYIGGETGVGGLQLGDSGALVSVGRTFGRLHLAGEYAISYLTDGKDDPLEARQQRVGATARWAWWRIGDGEVGYWDLAVEAGVGRDFLAWDKGGGLARNDVVLGLGTQAVVNLGGGRSRWFGLSYGLRVGVAEAPADSLQARAAAAAPAGQDLDLSLKVYVGFAWMK